MSDSSEDEDMSKFREAVDTSFVKLITKARGDEEEPDNIEKKKSERYLEIAGHYNDVKVPEELQRKIGDKISAIIRKNVEFVTVDTITKKHKIRGGVKLFKDSPDFLSCEETQDTYTENHNKESKKLKIKRRQIECDTDIQDENGKVAATAVSGEYVMSKEEVKCWKSRRKEKVYKYKCDGKSKVFTAAE